jgi:hypothetical protein
VPLNERLMNLALQACASAGLRGPHNLHLATYVVNADVSIDTPFKQCLII